MLLVFFLFYPPLPHFIPFHYPTSPILFPPLHQGVYVNTSVTLTTHEYLFRLSFCWFIIPCVWAWIRDETYDEQTHKQIDRLPDRCGNKCVMTVLLFLSLQIDSDFKKRDYKERTLRATKVRENKRNLILFVICQWKWMSSSSHLIYFCILSLCFFVYH